MAFQQLSMLFLCFLVSGKEINESRIINKTNPAQVKSNKGTEKNIHIESFYSKAIFRMTPATVTEAVEVTNVTEAVEVTNVTSSSTVNSSITPGKPTDFIPFFVQKTPEYKSTFKTTTEYIKVAKDELDSEVVKMKHTLIPDLQTLGPGLQKGTCGRVGVFGGTDLYSGAPYFSAMGALRSGMDLAYIFTTPVAATAIKSYSPEFMVLPYLDAHLDVWLLIPWLARVDVIILGPGLGTNGGIFELIKRIISILKSELDGKARPIIIDADGILFFMENHQIFKDYPGDVYLTPNEREFNKLTQKILNDSMTGEPPSLRTLAEVLGPKFTIILKGWKDLIANDKMMISCENEGSPRRCGGQGDLLGGVLGAFSYWIAERKDYRKKHHKSLTKHYTIEMLAAYSACSVIRTSNHRAFQQKGRSMLASDMLNEIPAALKTFFKQ